jgi:uncharacterized protein (DUF849 family)
MSSTLFSALVSVTAGLATGAAVDSLIPATPNELGLSIDKLAGAGAAALVVVVMWIWLKRDDAVRKDHAELLKNHLETTKQVAEEFSQSTKELGKEFSQTTATLLREARAESEKREENLRELMQRRP